MNSAAPSIDLLEKPATAGEEALADFLDHESEATYSGVPPALPDQPDLRSRAEDLAKGVYDLKKCASSIWEHATQDYFPAEPATSEYKPAIGSAAADPFPGEFRLVRKVGGGACGEVWLADDLHLPRQVAIKTLPANSDRHRAAMQLAAFRRDAFMLTQLRHPHVVQVLMWKQRGDDHFLILEYVDGGSLDQRIRREPLRRLEWMTAVRYVSDVADGLLAVHKQGIVHRDIKPANILLDTKRDEALLTDFGIATNLANGEDYAGTPSFMAPEAFDCPASAAQDVYSLAATLFCCIAGEPPFEGIAWPAIRDRIRVGLPLNDPRCREMPEPIERLIRAGMAFDPDRRPKLPEFVAGLRGEFNRLLADSMSSITPSTGSRLRLGVSRLTDGRYQRVSTSSPRPVPTRDIKRVPKPAPAVTLRTGDTIAVELKPDRTGYLTVFNVGPTGNLDLLFPDKLPEANSAPNVQAGERVWIDGLEIAEPAGRERLFAVWSAKPLILEEQSMREMVEPPTAYVATRDIRRVNKAVAELPTEDRIVEVLELDHSPAGSPT